MSAPGSSATRASTNALKLAWQRSMRSSAAGASSTASPSHATRRTASSEMSARVAIGTAIASPYKPGPRRLRGGVHRPKLLGVRDRGAPQRAVRGDGIGAHPPERRRVGVDRDRGFGGVLAHAVDVGGVEVEHGAGCVAAREGRPAEHEALFEDRAGDDGDGALRDVVVVEAGVVAVHPRDHPDVEVLVAPELLEAAALGVVGDQRPPCRRPAGEVAHDRAERGAVEVALERGHWGGGHAATSAVSVCSRRAGLRSRSAARTASPSSGSAPATTGMSEPWTTASTPSSRITASTARGPYEEESTNVAGSGTARPPRAASRSRCSGARPASIAKQTRSPGWAGRPATAKACQAAFMLAT